LIDLALHHGDDPLPLTVIAKNECVSKKYLNQLMGPLKVAGLVRVVRGKKGGFVLARSPSDITLGDILYAVEGDMTLIDCVRESTVCERSSQCPSRGIWLELSQVINVYLQKTTLADIVEKAGPFIQSSPPREKQQA